MSRLAAILLTTAILVQVFYRVAVYIDYEINKEYITLTYCVNRFKPSLKCEGKCHLAKKMKEGEKKEVPPSGKEISEIQLLAQLPLSSALQNNTETIQIFPSAEPHLIAGYGCSIFHPPC